MNSHNQFCMLMNHKCCAKFQNVCDDEALCNGLHLGKLHPRACGVCVGFCPKGSD